MYTNGSANCVAFDTMTNDVLYVQNSGPLFSLPKIAFTLVSVCCFYSTNGCFGEEECVAS